MHVLHPDDGEGAGPGDGPGDGPGEGPPHPASISFASSVHRDFTCEHHNESRILDAAFASYLH